MPANPRVEFAMTEDYDPNLSPGWERRNIVIGIILIMFGIGIIPISITAFRSGQPIPLLSLKRNIYGAEGFFITFCSVTFGLLGIWAAKRKKGR
jgi:hypothetical protein